MIDSTPSNNNRITSTGTKIHKVQLAPEEMKSSSDESGQFREVRNSFDGLNHSISGAIHTCYNIDPKSEHEWGSFRGGYVITS